MKNLTLVPNTTDAATARPVPLHYLIDQLLTGLLPLVTGKNSFIINDVDRSFCIQADEDVLAFILGHLLSGAVNSTENGYIRVAAILTDDSVQIQLRNNGAYLSNTANSFAQVIKAARKMGGDISISHLPHEGSAIIFSIATQKIAC